MVDQLLMSLYTHHTAEPTNSCPVFFNGASIGSPSNPLATMPPANITSIVDSQQASGCFLENAWALAPKSSRTASAASKLCAMSKNGNIFSLMTWLATSKNASGSMITALLVSCLHGWYSTSRRRMIILQINHYIFIKLNAMNQFVIPHINRLITWKQWLFYLYIE